MGARGFAQFCSGKYRWLSVFLVESHESFGNNTRHMKCSMTRQTISAQRPPPRDKNQQLDFHFDLGPIPVTLKRETLGPCIYEIRRLLHVSIFADFADRLLSLEIVSSFSKGNIEPQDKVMRIKKRKRTSEEQ